MATVAITGENFEEVVTTNDLVLVDFWAAWCGPCRSFAPTYEKVSAQYPDAVFAKVDTEAEQALAASFNIMSIPTLMIIRDQVVIFSQAGALPESALVDLVQKAAALDMEEIHRQIAQEAGEREAATDGASAQA
ncbi:MAG: thioredoxin [Acidobacteria bacterium]|nr:thioredoxin [Acidobacteriota bacterium]